jgi:type VI secretion system protein ImpE
MDAQELLRSGDLPGARAMLAEELRRTPGDSRARQFFWQLIAVAGDWDKASTQIRALAAADPKAMMMANVYGQALGAMKTRDAVFAGKEKPVSLVGQEPWVVGLLDALHAYTVVAPDAAARSEAALAEAPATPGSLNGERFEWIADADTRFGPMLEVIVGDAYGFVPFAAVTRLKAVEPVDLRDFVLHAVEIELKSGQTSMAMIPVVYPGTHKHNKPQLNLARATEWIDDGGGEIGVGQRIFTTDGPEVEFLALRDLRLD